MKQNKNMKYMNSRYEWVFEYLYITTENRKPVLPQPFTLLGGICSNLYRDMRETRI